MNRVLQGQLTFPLAIVFAGMGLGLWLGAALQSTTLTTLIGGVH